MAEINRVFPAYMLNREIVCVQPQFSLCHTHYSQKLFLTSFIHKGAWLRPHHLVELSLCDRKHTDCKRFGNVCLVPCFVSLSPYFIRRRSHLESARLDPNELHTDA